MRISRLFQLPPEASAYYRQLWPFVWHWAKPLRIFLGTSVILALSFVLKFVSGGSVEESLRTTLIALLILGAAFALRALIAAPVELDASAAHEKRTLEEQLATTKAALEDHEEYRKAQMNRARAEQQSRAELRLRVSDMGHALYPALHRELRPLTDEEVSQARRAVIAYFRELADLMREHGH